MDIHVTVIIRIITIIPDTRAFILKEYNRYGSFCIQSIFFYQQHYSEYQYTLPRRINQWNIPIIRIIHKTSGNYRHSSCPRTPGGFLLLNYITIRLKMTNHTRHLPVRQDSPPMRISKITHPLLRASPAYVLPLSLPAPHVLPLPEDPRAVQAPWEVPAAR